MIMTTEQKAKAYDEALERAKAILKVADNRQESLDYVSTIFPELKESEDERIRKGLIKTISSLLDNTILYNTDITREEALAWLEKQGEQNFDYEHADIPQKDFAPIEPKTLDADKVIEWLNENVADFWESPCNPQNIINQFKKNFEL